MRMSARRAVAAAILVVPLLGGLQAATAGAARTVRGAAPASSARTPRQHQREAVVRAWSERLNAGDYHGIAELFTVPTTLIQGAYAYRLVTRAQIAKWHSALPCTGKIVSITFSGRFATAVFRLGNRETVACDDPGGLAAARFEIVGGKIASWQQVPVPAQKPAGAGSVA